MEKTLDSWSKFVSNLRDTYSSLNYFTINQIQFLSSSITDFLRENISQRNMDLIISMLYDLSSNISKEELKSLLLASLNETGNDDEIDMSQGDTSDLEIAWEKFIMKQGSVENDLNAQLTLKSFAMLLETLNAKKQDVQIKRNIPGYLNQNKGNFKLKIKIQY